MTQLYLSLSLSRQHCHCHSGSVGSPCVFAVRSRRLFQCYDWKTIDDCWLSLGHVGCMHLPVTEKSVDNFTTKFKAAKTKH
eukprot:m.105064 g.105064  ORF g.105064 m.105064 type:complete len:81 (+) comp37216_c1_seq1:3040-3282(+)